MASLRNVLTGIFAAATLGLGVLAWRQHQELIALRAAAVTVPANSATTAGTVSNPPERETRTASAAATADAAASAKAPLASAGDVNRPARRNFAAVAESPEVQRLIALQQKGALDARYAALFKLLKLTPQQLDEFKNLLVEKSTATMDVMAAARAQGVSPRSDREAFQRLVADAQNEIDATIRATLGEPAFAEYKQYERTLPQRAVLEQLEQRLSYTTTPLTAEQSAQMLQILASTAPTNANGFPARRSMGTPTGGALTATAAANLTDATVTQALGVLAAPQLDALRELQQEQQSQAALAAAFRAQAAAERTTTPSGTTGSPPPRPPGG